MVRFIFICMGVVAVSILSIAGQFVFHGIQDAQKTVLARNDAGIAASSGSTATTTTDTQTPVLLNAIETAAGVVSYDPADTFSKGFTNVAPKALDDAPTIRAE